MIAFPRAYLAAVRASVAAGKQVAVGRLVVLSSRAAPAKLHVTGDRVLVHEVDAALVDLLNGRALDLPLPVETAEIVAAASAIGIDLAVALDELVRWQESVRDWLLRGTIAPVGDLGWLTVEDEMKTELEPLTGVRRTVSQAQRVRFLASPQLRAAVADVAVPPPVDLDRLTAILRVHASAPVEVTGDLHDLTEELERLGYTATTVLPPSPDVPPAIAELQRHCATRGLAHLRILAAATAIDDALPFAHDGEVIVACTQGGDDPGVFEQAARGPHRCPDDHPVRLSQWLAAVLLAADLERLAPASFPEDAMAAIADELAPYGRVAGALAHFVVTGPTWWRPPGTPPPPPPAAMRPRPPVAVAGEWMTVTSSPLTLKIAPGLAGGLLDHEARRAGMLLPHLEVPLARIFEIYPVPEEDGRAWLRLWGCFHDFAAYGAQDGVTLDLGPLPAAAAGAAAATLRRSIGLPRPLDPLLSTQTLVGRTVRQWVDVPGTWSPGDPARPSFDGVFLHLPRTLRQPFPGTRIRVHGLFDGPETLYALQWQPA